MANRERSSENPDEIAAPIRAKNADKKNTNKKQNSGNQNKKGGNNSEKVQPHWKIVRNNQRAEKNRSKADELRSQQELMQENVNTRKVEIRTKKELIELDAELAILNAEALKNEVKVEQEKPVDVEAIKVEVIQTAEDVVKETRDEQAKEIEKAVATGQIGVVQAEAIRSVLFDENTKQGFFGRLKDRVGDWSAKHPRLSSFLVGMGAGAAVRGAVKAGYVAAFGANLPFAIAAGATAGGLLEGGKALFRESKAYQSKEIMEKFNQADYLEKAALLTKLEELHKNQKFDASPEEYNQIKQTLDAARLNMQTELAKKDGKFANYSEKDKIEYLLGASQDIKNNYAKSDRGKEVQVLLNRIERNINYKRDFGNVFRNKKAIVGKAILRGAAYGALGSTVGAALVESADKLWNSGAVIQESTPIVETRANLSESYTNKLDHRGLTGGARDAIHTFIEEHKGVNANFASGVTIEQLVYAEDTLVKEALRQGIDVNSAEFTVSSGYVEEALEKAGVIGENAKLTEAGIKNIGELIQTKAHFLSEATKAKMLDFDPVAMEQFITETITESKAYEDVELTADDYAALAVVAAAVLASEAASRPGRENNTNENSTEIGGVALGGTPGNRGPENPPVTTPLASTPRTGDKPKGPDSPDAPVDFDWGKALSQDTETDGEEKEKAEPEKEKLSQAEAEFNQALIAAGINAEVHIDGNKKLEKQIDKIQYIVDEFIKSAKKLRTLNINTKIVLNMSSDKERTLVSDRDSVIVGIPVFSRVDWSDIESLVGRVIENEVAKKFLEFESKYDFKVKLSDQRVFDQLSPEDQYRALSRVKKAFDSIKPNELQRITKGLKAINIGETDFVERDEVTLQLIKLSKGGISYNALKPAEIIGLLRESHKERTAVLGPMNREEQFAKYPDLMTNDAFSKIPESKRVPAEEILLDIINRKFPDGLPSNVEIVLGDKYQTKPGELDLDLTKPDEAYLNRQLEEGLRRADPERLSKVSDAVKNRFSSMSVLRESKKPNDQVVAERFADVVIKQMGINLDHGSSKEVIDNDEVENKERLEKIQKQFRKKLPTTRIKHIESYFKRNKMKAEDFLESKDKLPNISKNITSENIIQYVVESSIDSIESLMSGSDDDKKKARELLTKVENFIKK